MILRSASFLILAALSGSSIAASFDCSKASNFAEREICRDGFLSGMDDTLNRKYREALQASSDQQALRASQRTWIGTRDACRVQKCIDVSISDRITELNQYIRDEKEKASIAAWEQQQAEMQAEQTRREEAISAELARQEADRQARLQAEARNKAAREATTPAPIFEQRPSPTSQPPNQPTYTQPERSHPVDPASKSLWDRFTDGPAWKYTLLALFAVLATAVGMHRAGELTVYIDYTDAIVTNSLPFGGLVAWLVLSWLEIPSPIPMIAGLTAVALAVLFAMWTSYQANDALWKVMISFVGKITLVGVFYALMALLLASLMSTKYKDETRAQAEARNRRNHRATRAQIAGLAVGYTFLTRWLCRYGEFSSISECLSFYPEGEEA